ncbi:MAG: pyridoxal phosphate-dependent aminotransferase, partial [Planctomycetota bacterium]
LDSKAKALIAEGRDILNLTAGEPDFNAPDSVREAARRAVDSGKVRYTVASGSVELRQIISDHVFETRGVRYALDEIAVCQSAKHALSGAFLSLVEPGDEVLVPLPAWVSYVEQIRFAGGVPKNVPPGEGLSLDLAALEAACGPKTKGMIINSPSNPSGYVMSEEEIRGVVQIAEKHDLWIISDEIYRRLVFDGSPNFSPSSVSEAARARTILIDGASKAYAMTGYRIGFLAAPREIAASVGRLHSQLTGSPNAISQFAYGEALREEPAEVARMVDAFRERRDAVVRGLDAIGLKYPRPRGAFYAFPDVSPFLDERGSVGFCEDLIEQGGLALVPGAAFGLDGHVRMSYATTVENIDEAVRRLGEFVKSRVPA